MLEIHLDIDGLIALARSAQATAVIAISPF
jgi:hypothetical protein